MSHVPSKLLAVLAASGLAMTLSACTSDSSDYDRGADDCGSHRVGDSDAQRHRVGH